MIVAVVAVAAMLGFSSCGDDDYWNPYPPNGWNNVFYDSDLTGSWMLVQDNFGNVPPSRTNYLYFNGRGRGNYYYYENGNLYNSRIAYWCEDFYGSGSNPEINIQYDNGQASTMSYWFSNNYNYLWMRWSTNQGIITYCYQYVDRIP